MKVIQIVNYLSPEVGSLLEILLGRKLGNIDGISEEEIDGRTLGILLDDTL